MKRWWTGVALLGALSGCGVQERVQETSSQLQQIAESAAQNARTGNANGESASIAREVARVKASLAPLPNGTNPNGRGLLLGEPVAVGALSANERAFGDGCAKWLFFHAAGTPELGRSPLWGALGDEQMRLVRRGKSGANALRLNATTGRALATRMGTPWFATGELKRNKDNTLTLSYTPTRASDGRKSVPIQVSGTVGQIANALPKLAVQLARAAGAKSPIVGGADAPQDLELFGRVGFKTRFKAPPATAQALTKVANRSAVGALLQERHVDLNGLQWRNAFANLLKLAPNNALAWAEVGWNENAVLRNRRPALQTLLKAHPDNLALHVSEGMWHRLMGDRAKTRASAETQVKCAPNNAMAWSQLKSAASWQATSIRGSRYANQLSGAEWAKLRTLYADQVAAASRATQLDPQSPYAWTDLAEAATFYGAPGVARQALTRSLAVDPTIPNTYEWGMNMLQPKWGGTNAETIKMAQLAASNAGLMARANERAPAWMIVAVLKEISRPDLRRPLMTQIVAADPKNAIALAELGAIHHYEDRAYRKAEKFYTQAIAADPNYARVHSFLGDLTYWVKQDPKKAEALYGRAIALDPSDGYFHANLARLMGLTGRQAQGLAEMQKAKALGYNDPSHAGWEQFGLQP